MFSRKKIDWQQRGQEAGSYVRQASSELVKYILENDKKKAKDNMAGPELLTYTSAFFFIICDREAQANKLSAEDNKAFADGILKEVVDGLSELWNKPNEIKLTVANVLNGDIDKLAPFAVQLFHEKDENPKGTLYWEFTKILGKDFGVDTTAAIGSYGLGAELVNSLLLATKQLL